MPIKKKHAHSRGWPENQGARVGAVGVLTKCIYVELVTLACTTLTFIFYCMYRERQWKGFQTSQIISVFSFSVSRPEVRRVWNDGQNSGTPLNVCLPYSGTPPRVKIHFFLGE